MIAEPVLAATARWSPNVVGAGWILLAAIAFTAMTTLVKVLGPGYSATLQTFYRQLTGLLVLLPLIVHHGRAAFATSRFGTMLLRSALMVVGNILTFESFRLLPLADANALSFTRVLWVVPIAALLLRERAGAIRLIASALGFVGVLVMLHPHGGVASWAHAAALGGALGLAFANVTAKSLADDHSTLVLLVWSAALGVVVALPPALPVWRWPSLPDLGLLAAMGLCSIAMQACYLRALRIADAAAVMPVDYVRLVLAAAIGYLMFGEIPGASAIAGAAIVVIATSAIVLSEHWAGQRLKAAAD